MLAKSMGAVLVSLTLAVAVVPAWAQTATTDPANKPAGDAATNSMVPYGVNPPVPDTSTAKPQDTVRPETTGERLAVPQGNFTSEKPDPAAPATPSETK